MIELAAMILRGLLWVPPALLLTAWGTAVLWIDGPQSTSLAPALAVLYPIASLGILIGVRPWYAKLAAFALLYVAVLAWWWSLAPSNERPWQREVARLPSAEVSGDRVTIRNLRNFDYHARDRFDERWEERVVHLSKLRGMDMFFSHWSSPLIAHTIVSWDFGDEGHVAISIETRKEEGEVYSAVLGFFRQFEVYYVVADERDLIGQRTNHRKEDVYVYRLEHPLSEERALFLNYLEEINRLVTQPEWYNALTHNCTTTIRHHSQQVTPGRPFDWRVLVNGRLPELGYERGTIDTSLPFEELKARSAISARALAVGVGPDFSTRIREGVPGMSGP